VQIGDNAVADVMGAQTIGMRGILIDRLGRHGGKDYPVVRALADVPEVVARLS